MRLGASLVLVLAAAARAFAQPAPQAAPQDPYAAPGQDPVLAEQVADQLVTRAQELFEAKIYLDAKQLAVEALVESPKGPAAERAKFLIKQVNQQLGISDEPQQTPPPDVKPPDLRPIEEPKPPPKEQPPGPETHDAKPAAMVHGAYYGGLVGATVGAYLDRSSPASGAVPVGVLAALASGIETPKLTSYLKWDEAQVRTVGSASVWGSVIGGMFTEVVVGANGGHVTAPPILLGGTIGATVGIGGGALYARQKTLTRGDVALIDTFAGMGTVGGLTIGMLMQPAQQEGYTLNAALGAAAGVAVGLLAAPQTNTTPRRMLRVAGLAAAGGALPFAIIPASPHSPGLQRAVGLLSSAGLVGGAWLGFYLTRDMDVGLDVPDGAEKHEDAPPALVDRDSNGTWRAGGAALMPLSPELSTDRTGLGISLFGGAFQ